MNVLITGGAGYIGSCVTEHLINSNHIVTCVDNLSFGKSNTQELLSYKNYSFINADINNFEEIRKIFKANSFDAIIHLAAIVGDPACKIYSTLAKETNYHSTLHLINLAIEHNIEKFIFASTCSNYGKMDSKTNFVDENSVLAPVSLYAELKVDIEDYILNKIEKTNSFSPTILRFSTVYGLSARMRFDLTINEFCKDAYFKNELLVYGENFWRPYCHVDDFGKAFNIVLNSPKNKVSYEVFNVGDKDQNFTKLMIVKKIKKIIPNLKINFVNVNEDPRDYKVNFDKIKKVLGFKISKDVSMGINEIIKYVSYNNEDFFEHKKFYNIPKKNG